MLSCKEAYHKLSAKEKELYSYAQFEALYTLIQCSEQEKDTSLINTHSLIPTPKKEHHHSDGLINSGTNLIKG